MKRNFIKLVNNVKEVQEKNAEPKFETHLTPDFIPFRKIYNASDVMDELNKDDVTEKQAMDMMLDMVVEIYDKKFTKDELLDGLHSPDAVTELQQQVQFVAEGQMDDDRKKQLAKMV